MRSVETELARLRNGDYIGWLGWLALERSGDPRVLAGIIQRLRRPAVPSWGTACSLAVHLDRFQAATPAQTELWSPRRLGVDADQPHRIKYKRFARA